MTADIGMFKLCLYILEEVIMAEVVLDIKQWGNNLGVRLPATIAREARLCDDQRMCV